MKPVYTRRYRRRSAAVPEGNFFKKENSEQSFFSEPAVSPFFSATPVAGNAAPVQRKCDHCEQEDKKLHRMADEKKEEGKLQRKENAGGNTASAAGYVGNINGRGTPMSPAVNNFFSGRMGYDFSGVHIHTGADAAASARSINAKAYTIGNNIVFNNGQYQPGTPEGKKLLAHELTHVVQQQQGVVARAVDEAGCDDASLNLEGNTDAVYNKGAGKVIGEKKKASKECESCDDDCVKYTGTLSVPYNTQTTVTLPDVPDDLRPCQQKRVATAIKTKLAPHEQKHVSAFKTFDGTAFLPIKYVGCEGGYNSYLEDLAQTEFDRRKDLADKKSAKLDPFSVDVDLCCKDADTATHPTGGKK